MPYIKVSAYVSTDWGVTWNSPYPNGIFDQFSADDPAAGIDMNGYLYVSYRGFNGIRVARSTNLGNNWTFSTASTNSIVDKDYLHIDNSCNSYLNGRIYCAWTGADGGGGGSGIIFVYSTDRGQNWSQPNLISAGGTPHGVNIKTDNSGNVYVAWALHLNQGGDWYQIQFIKSTNGGVNWSQISTIDLPFFANQTQSGDGPSMSVNMQGGPIYMVYSINVNALQYDVFLKKSYDGGSSWSGGTRVNQVQTNNQTLPWISCDPMSGYLACIYYDTRNGDKHTYVSVSTDAGETWCDRRVSSQPWLGTAVGSNHYIGIEFNKGIIYPVWADTRRGDGRYHTYVYPFDVIERDLSVPNQTYTGTVFIQSAKTLTSSNITLNAGANVTFRSVGSITLEPGFVMDGNSIFKAELFQCGDYIVPEKIAQSIPTETEGKSIKVPLEFSLSQNYPNPFNPTTSINYSLKHDSWVTIVIYNILGQEVKRLIDNYEVAGYKSVIWVGTNNYGSLVSSGIYFCKLIARQNTGSLTGDFVDQIKMAIIR
ncbi:MAG: exo-alpha-sialidase [Ignavibacteria bacterium]|nr:exo-alpha-sialidase [Ignavibacteria bacterium]